MKAVQLLAPNRVEVREVPVPEPGAGQVLLKVAAAGMCGSDLHIIHGPPALFDPHKGGFPLPLTLGHETTGHVLALGPGTKEIADDAGIGLGAAVMVYGIWGCGVCRACEQGHANACSYWATRASVPRGPGLGYAGGMAEYMVAPIQQLFPLGDLDPVAAAPLTDAGATPCHAINTVRDALRPDATVVVIGVGGLGHMALQILRATTSARVIAIDSDPERLGAATSYGADLALPSDSTAVASIRALTRGLGADVVLDFVGVTATLSLGSEAVRRYGRLVVVGLGGGELTLRASSPARGGVPGWGVTLSRPYGATRSDLREVISLAQAGRLHATIERHRLDTATQVFDRLAQGHVQGRAVLVP